MIRSRGQSPWHALGMPRAASGLLPPASASVFPWLCCCLVVGDAGLSPSDPCGEEQKPRLGLFQLLHVAASFENNRVATAGERPVTSLLPLGIFRGGT